MRFAPTPLMLGLLCAIASGGAMASGYHFGSQSASAQGTANANAAEAADASVLFYNPAGMTRLDGTHASGVLNIVVPSTKYEDQGSFTATSLPISGGNTKKFVKTTAVPHGYLTHKLSNDLSVGMAVFVPFGSKTEYDKTWAGRYTSLSTELTTIAFNPSVAYKLSPTLSLGAGVTAQYIDGKLAKGADFGAGSMNLLLSQVVAANAAANPGVPIQMIRAAVMNQFSGLIKKVSGQPDYSGGVEVKGHDWGFGFNLGLMYEYDKDTRFGVAYRSAIKHKLKGDATWDVQFAASNIAATVNAIPQLPANTGTGIQQRLMAAYTNSDASLDITTPESLSFNFFKQHDRFGVMGDITWTRHSRFKELRIDFANNLPDSNTPENWTNTLRASLGLNYQWSDALTLRGGVAFDQSPVTQRNRTASLPDSDRSWISAGLNWKLDKKRSIDLAASYVHVKSGQIDQYDNGGIVDASGAPVCDSTRNTSSCATTRGNYKLNSLLFGVQYNHQF
ncbi:UNVERIFIED_ORG: OmpP1/FadL family transporter [Shinella sp. XGS7]|nr:OmpP1/FadL family transporter [Shinella sp. XGS7]